MIEVEIDTDVYLPCYHHLLDDSEEIDIELIWGGRDSGKSKFAAQYLIEQSMGSEYFRCLLIKQTQESIKESQWQMIKDTCEEWGVSQLFHFQIAPLGLKVVNGNTFSARGMDDPAKIKSFTNPSHAWIEEGNDISEDAFITLLSGMRNDYGRVKIIITFNPEVNSPDYSDFWIYKWFFEKYPGQSDFVGEKVIKIKVEGRDKEIKLKYRSTHTTYHDNPYVSWQRIAFHEMLEETSSYYYTVYTKGLWGNQLVTDPFCFAFNKEKHKKPTKLNKAYDVKLSFDFNVNPITCGVYQDYNNWIYGIESIKLDNSDIYKLCDYITTIYRGCLFVVTGDATGKNTSAMVQDGINYYTIIKSKLSLSNGQIKVPSVNPTIKENKVLVNAVLYNYNVALDPERCKGLIFDCENVSVNDMGKIDKGDRSNPKKRADHLDGFRYYLNQFHKHLLKI